ncbi:MAG TPA: CSLREA domain-containing protein, partial [Burkholderiales bacterium]|nr:CSLREA domain-containing protein [Burkholderiales bacterium]
MSSQTTLSIRRCLRLFIVIVGLGQSSAWAAVFTVNSTVDAVDFKPGDGVCETALGNGVCSLRAAIQE